MALFNAPQDEGYSEAPLGKQLSNRNSQRMDPAVASWYSSLDVDDRISLAMTIMSDLPTSAVYDIVNAMGPLLHVNFMDRLPTEVCLKILGFLDPFSVLQMAQTSHGSMALSLDWKLWQQLYYREGWLINEVELQNFEKGLLNETLAAKPEVRPQGGLIRKQSSSNDRVPPRKQLKLMANNSPEFYAKDQDNDLEMVDVEPRSPHEQKSIFGNPAAPRPQSTTPEEIYSRNNLTSSQRELRTSSENESSISQSNLRIQSTQSTNLGPPSDIASMSSLVVLDRRENKHKLNWQYLYAQRSRLESNWESEKYVNFQLPHPDYPNEAHAECIYTIQHSGKYLVSGSRDMTLRIWNLDTKRLIMPPLEGHNGSVLCLQFDPDPSEDIIVSGSSDATVRIWRFSTGKLLHVMRKAHREPVLNVRFDRRILATCSKDKTIKIFNRRPMHPGELGYPNTQGGITAPTSVLNNYGFNPSPYDNLPIKPAYTQIGCLEGHGAAVNAIQIYENELVSASGDRNVKVWDWPLQSCIRTLVGHQKGIACVQYDGRRIVSGSSDNEVKVFDKETGLEVASLRAHTHLVRTVQAGFGDLPGSVEDDEAAAKNVDNDYFRAVDTGIISHDLPKSKSRNAGSSRPEHIMAYGAKVPPGGGGGRYGRIVSGSYDETIIIWRRDKEGVWKAKHTFRQVDAARSALADFRANNPFPVMGGGLFEIPGQTPGTPSYFHALIDLVVPLGPSALRQVVNQYPNIVQYGRLLSAIMAEPVEAKRQQMRAIMNTAIHRQQVASALHHVSHTPNAPPNGSSSDSLNPIATAVGSLNNPHINATVSPVSLIQNAPGISAQPQSVNALSQTAAHQPTHSHPHHQNSAGNTQAGNEPSTSAIAQNALLAAHQVAQAQQPSAQAQAHIQAQVQAQVQSQAQQAANPTSMARVFKLQFDARRIICCSQTTVIVGWDFANKDPKIEEASKFFRAVE